MSPTVAVIRGAYDEATVRLFQNQGFQPVDSVVAADLVCFTGGEDVNPVLYGQKPMKTTMFNSQRDLGEKRIFELIAQKPKVGICRGGQFLNVMSGGTMWQDVDRHGVPHLIKDVDSGTTIKVTSMHHQMMIPSDSGQVLATAKQSQFWSKMDQDDQPVCMELDGPSKSWTDVEVVYYKDTNSLCFQPHPELGDFHERQYFFELLAHYLGISRDFQRGTSKEARTMSPPFDLEDAEMNEMDKLSEDYFAKYGRYE